MRLLAPGLKKMPDKMFGLITITEKVTNTGLTKYEFVWDKNLPEL